jgi:hypothetical protein
MTKKHFIEMADEIRAFNAQVDPSQDEQGFNWQQINCLANFCRRQNANFKTDRWLDYIAGRCGPNGGSR